MEKNLLKLSEQVSLMATIADLKEEQYNTNITLDALLTILIQQKIITHEQLIGLRNQLDEYNEITSISC